MTEGMFDTVDGDPVLYRKCGGLSISEMTDVLRRIDERLAIVERRTKQLPSVPTRRQVWLFVIAIFFASWIGAAVWRLVEANAHLEEEIDRVEHDAEHVREMIERERECRMITGDKEHGL